MATDISTFSCWTFSFWKVVVWHRWGSDIVVDRGRPFEGAAGLISIAEFGPGFGRLAG